MKMLRRLWWIGVGAGLAWLFDPERGAERRAQVKSKLESFGGGAQPEASPPLSLADETRDPLHETATAR